ADVDDAGVLAGALDDARPARRQPAQVDARRLVRAVLAPHDAEDAELGVGRRAAEDLVHATELVGAEPVLLRRRFVDRGFFFRRAHTRRPISARSEANSILPSSEPSSASLARSGCGIRPNTLPRALHVPAMLATEPLGLAPSETPPVGST